MTKEEAIGILNETQVVYFAPNGKKKVQEALDMAIEALSEPEHKTGEWIRWVVDIEDETGVLYIPHAKCSNCGTEQDSYTKYCPNCGAKMGEK